MSNIINNLKNDNEGYTYEIDVENFYNLNSDYLKNKIIWCPFDTENSAFVKVFKKHDCNVIYSHIDGGFDFYEYEPPDYDIIISNPPFNGKAKLMERLIELNKPFAMIFGVQCFNSSGFVRVLSRVNNLQLVFQQKRMKFHKIDLNAFSNPPFHSLWICNDIENFKPINFILKDGENKNE